MTVKERFQNPVSGDTVRLRLFTYNSNSFADIDSFEKVDIYYLDPNERTEANPDGRRLVESIDGSAITQSDTGHYLLDLETETDKYVIGRYLDVWTMYPILEQPVQTVTNYFDIHSNLWYSTTEPVVYDFSFHFQPNRLRQGSKQYLIAEITPNVPKATDLCRYYENLIVGATVYISIEQMCGPCTPQEADLALEVDNEPIELREKRFAYYHLDTEDLDCGIYNVWFKLEFGGNTYISDKMQLEIFA